jgi:hypothetical protein
MPVKNHVEQLLPHFKIDLVALGMVGERPSAAQYDGSSLGVKATRRRGADTYSGVSMTTLPRNREVITV